MSRASLRVAAVQPAAQPARPRGQVSFSNGFEGRGRAPITRGRLRGRGLPDVSSHAAKAAWAVLLMECCGDRETTAAAFGVTFQCACNWWDEVSRPQLDYVLRAYAAWPEAFARIMGGVR